MKISEYLPIWHKLNEEEKELIEKTAALRHAKPGDMIHAVGQECTGLLLVASGQLRAFINSESGREITLYRLLDGDICLFSASCIIRSLQFDISVSSEKETDFFIIPTDVFESLMNKSIAVSSYTNEIMASRMTDIMWLMEQVIWQSFDKRLATFLIEESALEESQTLSITHDTISNHLGTAREVVTRMLKYFQSEGMVSLSRGSITITDLEKLNYLRSIPQG